MGSYGFLWIPMDSYGILRNLVESYRILWKSMESYGILWIASEELKRVVVPLGLYCFVVRVYDLVWELALGAGP